MYSRLCAIMINVIAWLDVCMIVTLMPCGWSCFLCFMCELNKAVSMSEPRKVFVNMMNGLLNQACSLKEHLGTVGSY